MKVITTDQWDESLWNTAASVYEQAFPEHGRKNRPIIQNMFRKHLCHLHVAMNAGEAIAMALTGSVDKNGALILDYFAVREDQRGQGIGAAFLTYIKNWAKEVQYKLLVIEIESEKNEINANRAQFWSKLGFAHTDYIHHYIWVPEPYRAMYLPLQPGSTSYDGKQLFSYITGFHQKSYQK